MTEKQNEKNREKMENEISEFTKELFNKAMDYIMNRNEFKNVDYVKDMVIYNKMGLLSYRISSGQYDELVALGWNANDLTVDYIKETVRIGMIEIAFKTPTGFNISLYVFFPEKEKLSKDQWKEYQLFKFLCQ